MKKISGENISNLARPISTNEEGFQELELEQIYNKGIIKSVVVNKGPIFYNPLTGLFHQKRLNSIWTVGTIYPEDSKTILEICDTPPQDVLNALVNIESLTDDRIKELVDTNAQMIKAVYHVYPYHNWK